MNNKNDIHILVGSLGGGGAERVAINLANNMQQRITLLSLTCYQDYDLGSFNKNVEFNYFSKKKDKRVNLKIFFFI